MATALPFAGAAGVSVAADRGPWAARFVVATVIAAAVETSRPLIDAAKHELTVALPPRPLGDWPSFQQVSPSAQLYPSGQLDWGPHRNCPEGGFGE